MGNRHVQLLEDAGLLEPIEKGPAGKWVGGDLDRRGLLKRTMSLAREFRSDEPQHVNMLYALLDEFGDRAVATLLLRLARSGDVYFNIENLTIMMGNTEVQAAIGQKRKADVRNGLMGLGFAGGLLWFVFANLDKVAAMLAAAISVL